MIKISRRNFLGYFSARTIIPLIDQKEISAQVKNFKMISPVNGFIYTYVGGPIEFRLNLRPKQFFPKIVRVDYRSNGVLIGSGFPHSNPNQNFYFSWSIPIPPIEGINYSVTAEAIQARTGNIIATDSANFRVIRLLG